MLTSVFPLVFVVAAIVVLAATGNLFSSRPLVIAVQVVAVGVSVWARRSFQKGTFRVSAAPGGTSLIRHGPYRLIRHPMYLAALIFLWAAVAGHTSPLTLAIGSAVTVVVTVRVLAEERVLRAAYPEYRDYARSTKALVPYVF